VPIWVPCWRDIIGDGGARCRREVDGVTGRQPTMVVAVAVAHDDGVGKRSQAGPAPNIIGGRPWSTIPVSTYHWKAHACALSTRQGGLCASTARGISRRQTAPDIASCRDPAICRATTNDFTAYDPPSRHCW